jgi:hypothetical protein
MQQSDRDPWNPRSGSWGHQIANGDPTAHYSQEFFACLAGTEERALSWCERKIRDDHGAREFAAVIVAHNLQSKVQSSIFVQIGGDRLRLPNGAYEKIVGQAQEVSTDAAEKPSDSEASAMSTAPALPRESESEPDQNSGRITHVGDGVLRRAVLPDCQDVVWLIHKYSGIDIKSLARVRVACRGGNPDLDDDAFRKAMRDANAAGKAGYVRRIGDQFWPLDYPSENAA